MSEDASNDAQNNSARMAAEEDVPTQNGAAQDESGDVEMKEDAAALSDADQKDADTQENGVSAAEADEAPAQIAADGAETEKKSKRKSSSGVPEHRGKKLNKKKSMVTLNLDCKPGEYYWARMKGHPPWPAIIADESMLPEALLATRPVSTTRPDGSFRDDFKEGGKNIKERTYAVMYLATNEFSWIHNTSLTPLDVEDCKQPPKSKANRIQEAYDLAIEQHDLEYFKDLLEQARQERQKLIEDQQAAEAEAARKAEERQAKAEEKKKKAPRKSKAADEDVEMEDADAPKSAKKRKKGEESDGEGIKPKKTPKVTKLNGPKTPADAETPTAKKTAAKPKKKVAAPQKEEEEADVRMTEEERLERLEKEILYFRHKLQKGFLARDEQPKEEEMSTMSKLFEQLEKHEELPAPIIRRTKVHKVLKAIVKLSSIPHEEKYSFKKRSSTLLGIWNKLMEAEAETAESKPEASNEKSTETNGNSSSETKKASAPAASKGEDGEDKEDDENSKATDSKPDGDNVDEDQAESAPAEEDKEEAGENDKEMDDSA